MYTHTLLMAFLTDFVNIGHFFFFFAQCNNRGNVTFGNKKEKKIEFP